MFSNEMLNGSEGLKKALSDFAKPEFAINKRKFRISKMGALAAFELGEKIRFALSKVDIDPKNVSQGAQTAETLMMVFVQGVLSLDPETVKEIREALFETIDFSGDDVKKGWLNVGSNPDMAFNGLEAAHIYELILRALAVNFFGSFSGLISALGDSPKDSKA